MKKSDYQTYFKGKKITVMGLGLSGGALNDIIFLHKAGAKVTVTDTKTKAELAPSVKKLAPYKGITYALGGHRVEDFENADIILEPGNVPKDSPYLLAANKHSIPIHVSESLFAMAAKDVVLVGVTGTRGKSFTTHLIYHILKANPPKGRKVFLGGNVRNVSTLALLSKVNKGDIVVLELDSWALHGLGTVRVSPHIAVFTSFMPDHMNYYRDDLGAYFKDKANIFKYQKKGDILIIRPGMKKMIKATDTKGKLIAASAKKIVGWKTTFFGDHNLENAACAYEVGKVFGISEKNINRAIESFKGVEGRLQSMDKVRGIRIVNDNNATTPEATIAGIQALNSKLSATSSLILIAGGADKGLDLGSLVKEIQKCKAVVLLPGTGTNKLTAHSLQLTGNAIQAKDMKDAVKKAFASAKKGDTILFSPGFASFGPPPGGFQNEYDRNDQFVKEIKKWKK